MNRLLPVLILTCLLTVFGLPGAAFAAGESGRGGTGSVNQQVRDLQERMMSDQEIMSLILALSAEPEMQEILNDPAVLGAVNSGDIDSLAKNPRFMRLLENARVKEIQRRLGQ